MPIGLVILLTLAGGCDSTEYVNVIDSVLAPVDQVNFKNIPFISISDSTWSVSPERGRTAQNFVGKFDIYESAMLLKFHGNSLLPDTANISEIFLEMEVANTIGDSSIAAVGISLRKNTLTWTEDNISELNFDDINSSGELYDATSAAWRTADSSTQLLSFKVSKPVYQGWLEKSDTNGVLIVGDDAGGFIISSHSRTSGRSFQFLPVLRINFNEDSDSTLTTNRFSARADGYVMKILEDLTVTDTDRVYIGGGAAFRGIIKFDPDLLDQIQSNFLISKAEIKLTIDYDRSILPTLNSAVSGILFDLRYSIIDSIGPTGLPLKISSGDSLSMSAPLTGATLNLNVTPFIQQWVTDGIENLGIQIWSSGEHSQIYRISLISGDSMDSDALKPEIDIFYVEPPDFSN